MNLIIIDGLSFALPLFIMAIGGIYCERSGITNLALEGLQGMGAFTGSLTSFLTKQLNKSIFGTVSDKFVLGVSERITVSGRSEIPVVGAFLQICIHMK